MRRTTGRGYILGTGGAPVRLKLNRKQGADFTRAARNRYQVRIGVPCGFELDIMASEMLSTRKMCGQNAGGNVLNLAMGAFVSRNSQHTVYARSGLYV
jgi:hypothetical protein